MKHILSFKRLFEGLIKSLPVLDAQKVLISNLRKKFGDNRIKDWEANVYYDGGVIVLTVEVTEKTDGDLIDKILSSVKLMDTVGWYLSHLRVVGKEISYRDTPTMRNLLLSWIGEIDEDDTAVISFIFSKKFNDPIEVKDKYLYHFSIPRYENRILKQGLVPKSKYKINYHPDRIYLCSFNMLPEVFSGLSTKEDVPFSLFKIKNDGLRLFLDMDWFGLKTKGVFYTTDNISPEKISLVKKVHSKEEFLSSSDI